MSTTRAVRVCVCVCVWGRLEAKVTSYVPAAVVQLNPDPLKAKVNDVIHSPLSLPLSRPVCCGASNQTNVQRLGQLNCRNSRRLHVLSSGGRGSSD